jgi:8-oxo-dGTP pyrophosphatase MutT (NUDIX family)
LGEGTLMAGAREVLEETQIPSNMLRFHPIPYLSTDAIYRDAKGDLMFHYVISHCFAWMIDLKFNAIASDDLMAVRWVTVPEIKQQRQDNQLLNELMDVILHAEKLISCGVIDQNNCVQASQRLSHILDHS